MDAAMSDDLGRNKEEEYSHGHALELARMLPGRYSSSVWNIPFFVAFSGVSFLGVWFFFSQDPKYESNPTYYDLSLTTWATINGII